MQQKQNTKAVVVTGYAGYIGGQTCIELKKQGYEVFGIDRRLVEHTTNFVDEFVTSDFCDHDSLSLIKKVKPAAIIHCAGTSLVGPSMEMPEVYFENNVARTNRLLEFVSRYAKDTKIIFSSSAAVYGDPGNLSNIIEGTDTNPISPYGESKLMVEKLLRWYKQCHGIDYVSFRYFNAAGADPEGNHGQEPNATHIIAKLFEAALNDTEFNMYGSTYPTKDGTCIRDYIHVADIARAHVAAIDKYITGIYNLGSLAGTSNLEMQMLVEKTIGKEIVTVFQHMRPGDPARLVADSSKFRSVADWTPHYSNEDIVKDAYKWYTSDTYKTLQRPLRRSFPL